MPPVQALHPVDPPASWYSPPGQLLHVDCVDLVHLGRACAGELCVNFNAPNAGASQNHLHAHAWVVPPEGYPLSSAPPLDGGLGRTRGFHVEKLPERSFRGALTSGNRGNRNRQS